MPKILRTDVLDDREYQGGTGQEVEATETREFAWQGRRFITYLCADNAKDFDELMAPWVEFAEEVKPGASPRRASTTGGTTTAPRRDRTQTARIRAWAIEQNFQPPVSARGRIPEPVTEAYYKSHPEEVRPAA